MFEFYTKGGSKVAVPPGTAFAWAFRQYPDGYILDNLDNNAIFLDEYNAGFVNLDAAPEATCHARMNEEIGRQQDKDNSIMPEMKKNKKDAVGATKADTAAIPSVAVFALGAAMADGAKKYDPYNYRESRVTASVFHNAMNRHHWDWWEGEDYAEDSLVHHLGHLMACCAILLDSISAGNFVDDRPNTRILGASRRVNVWKKVSE
jgi:hypothetical protein